MAEKFRFLIQITILKYKYVLKNLMKEEYFNGGSMKRYPNFGQLGWTNIPYATSCRSANVNTKTGSVLPVFFVAKICFYYKKKSVHILLDLLPRGALKWIPSGYLVSGISTDLCLYQKNASNKSHSE